MKSIKMFGKSVPLVAIVLACTLTIGASAYLATFLSNTVTSDVTVTSPMVARILISNRTDWATAQRWRPEYWRYPSSGAVLEPGAMLDAFPEGLLMDGVTYVGFGDASGWQYSDWTGIGTVEIMGGETITMYLMSENLADGHINAHEEIRVSNPEGLTKDDFTNITCRFDPIYSDNGYSREYIDNLGPKDMNPVPNTGDTCLEFWEPWNTSDWGTGETDVSRWQITFNGAASGTYTFSYRITPAVPEPPEDP